MKKIKGVILTGCLFLSIGIAACSLPFSPALRPVVETRATSLPALPTSGLASTQAAVPTKILATPLELCAGPQPTFITDLQVRQPPEMPEPPARQPFRDPLFGTCIVRVSDTRQDLAFSDSSPGLKNEYSRVQAYNVPGTLMVLRGINATWYLYDARTLHPLRKLPFEGEADPRWDGDSPNRLYFWEETSLNVYDADAGQVSLVHDFAADFPGQPLARVWTRYEGSPSHDGRFWGLMAQNTDWETVTFLSYDARQDRILARLDTPQKPTVDSVTISPLGNYFLVYADACETVWQGSPQNPCGLTVYDRQLKNARGLLRAIGHSDTALDAAGREVLVYQDIDTDQISLLDLASGQVTALLPIDFSYSALGFHFSGRALDRPGWALVSTYNGSRPQSATWMDDSLFALELRKGGRIVRLAHTHSIYNEQVEHDYWAEPQATANRDFTRLLFTSNWGRSGTEQVDTFMIALSPDWVANIP